MSGILILAPDPSDNRFHSRTGDAFDTAFVEVLRTLDAAGGGFPVLAPWTNDMAPLVLAATIDTAPGFDPEGGGSAPESRSRIVPYFLPDQAAPGPESPFWRASTISLTREAAIPLWLALAEHPPNFLLVLGLPEDAADLLAGLDLAQVKVLTFGNLLPTAEVEGRLRMQGDRVLDLQRVIPQAVEPEVERMPEDALEDSAEGGLEPYVPYGLLLQAALGEFLPGEEREGRGPVG